MIKIQLGTGKISAAILARVVIANIDIQPGKANRSFWNSVIEMQHDHPRHPNGLADHADMLVIDSHCQFGPALKIKQRVFTIDHLGNTPIKHADGMPDSGYMDG